MTPGGAAPTVFEDVRPRLEAVARSITRNQQDAEDVVQDVWIRYAKQEGQLLAAWRWLLAATRNTAIDLLRRRAARREISLSDTIAASVPERSPSPLDCALASERLRHGVERLLRCLSPAERVALVGRQFADLSYRELSVGMKRTEVAVRQLHHRAMMHLQSGVSRYATSTDEVEAVTRDLRDAGAAGDVQGLLVRLGGQAAWSVVSDLSRQAPCRVTEQPSGV